MLSPYRVLELSSQRTYFAGYLLADLGADVIVIEPPSGSELRQMPPFAPGDSDERKSLWWWAYNRNKRSVSLDLTTADGQSHLKKLIETADYFIEGSAPGDLTRLGLSYDELKAINPRLIMVSITTFGQDGPRADQKGSDLVAFAASGTLSTWGDADRAPVMMALPQAFLHAGSDAAAGALVALFDRLATGRGQHVDVSAQASCTLIGAGHTLTGSWGDRNFDRTGSGLKFGPLDLRMTFECKDGYIAGGLFFGTAIGPATQRLMNLVYEEGFCDEATRDKDWIAYTNLILSGEEPVSELARVHDCVAQFLAAHTKAEVYEMAREHDLLFSPVNTPPDLLNDAQLRARDYWQETRELSDKAIVYPGAFAKFSETPLTLKTSAPSIGQHNDEVLAAPRANHDASSDESPSPVSTEKRRGPLHGITVIDLTWALAGPVGTRLLADFGATVIHIETTKRMDPARTAPPFKDATPGPERSAGFANFNANKYCITLNLANDLGKQTFLRLVENADVVAESFTPDSIERLGLQYKTLREINPDIVMLSTCLHGQTGPEANRIGYGVQGAGQAGFTGLLGWPDRPPALPGAYTDFVASRFVPLAVLSALDVRRRTGKGQHIDLSQVEAAIHFLAPWVMNYSASGDVIARNGNRLDGLAPHGVFPCSGDDRWIAIGVESDEQWNALCQATGNGAWAGDPRFADLASRKQNESELEAAISQWTSGRTREEIEGLLRAAGVPCAVVFDEIELWQEPQLRHRNHFLELPQAVLGKVLVEGPRVNLERSTTVDGWVPTHGEHTHWVLREIAGLSDAEISDLAAHGALE